jgi:hypothetical protein
MKEVESSSQNDEGIVVPMKAENWEFKPKTLEFMEYKSRPAMKLLTSSDQVILKDLIENTLFRVPLNEGENQLLIGVANSFYGWGIVARLDKLTDLTLENNL